MPDAWLTEDVVRRCGWLATSFRRWTGRDLIADPPQGAALAEALYHAPAVVVSHGTQPDPVFWFANRTAQRLWELDWDAFTRMPSRQSVAADEHASREDLLRRALTRGFIEDYQGVRISASGRRFRIANVVLWNIRDDHDRPQGQAATFADWSFL
jgi:hypothetical protein